ncbi:hypothetical protein [Paracoccus sanguinis]|uniref:Uncharacterized protein n=1 Tax=Paracoccus sanguinis TaxID=1545044 RepID=A0A1H2SQJ0_9RHOB|nr:hypothetical protein [Paracoccus sanguinis]SDW33923.1 hypothetical protein SAMN05444276_101698 [Paracoccus sanguinis]
MRDDVAHIEVIIRNSEPIELLDFTASLTGIAREHELRLKERSPRIEVDQTRLLIVDIRKGSIVLELLPILAPIISTAEMTNTAVDFVSHMKRVFGQLRQPGGRAEGATTAQLKNLNDTVQTVANDSNGELFIAARYQNGEVIQELVINKNEAAIISENATSQRKEIEATGSAKLSRVLMRLHQSSVDDLKVGRKTSEKGIVERVDLKPRALIYASDLAGQRIKDEILKDDGNPFQKGFVVDLDVETVGGKPRAYRILAVHEVIDLDEDD